MITSNSIGINEEIEVIETNSDPIWENDNDFYELRKMVINDNTIIG